MKDVEYAKLLKETDDWETLGSDTQCKIVEKEGETIIVFAESNSKIDWKINFNFPKKAYKKEKQSMFVHRGFLGEWKKIKDYFVNYLEEKFYYGESVGKITIVGWSYGGAMATLCMEELKYSFPLLKDNMRLITFGSPRVIGFYNFNKNKHIWENCSRYTNSSDLVTCIPFVVMLFRHVKKETHIGKRKCLFGYLRVRKNHHIDGYIENCGSY